MDEKDYLEEVEAEETKEAKDGEDKDNDYEDVCFLCHRPESKTGKLITLAKGICICSECMQKTMDTFQNGNQDFSKIPGLSFINLADLQNMIPQRQKVKKKKPKEEKPIKELDIRSIPAPHKDLKSVVYGNRVGGRGGGRGGCGGEPPKFPPQRKGG